MMFSHLLNWPKTDYGDTLAKNFEELSFMVMASASESKIY